MTRTSEIAENLERTRERIAKACDSVGRDPESVTLIAVTKTFPSSDIRILADLGIADVGENREQEGASKVEELEDLNLRWHFIGQLQRNKARKVAAWADVIHSVDRVELIDLLGDREVLIQVNLDPSATGRGGVWPDQVESLASKVQEAKTVLRGLMAVAPLGEHPDRPFAELSALHRQILITHPQATWLSAGMSSDLESAIAYGATHIRLGSSILGSRRLLQ